ncbi:methyltransferase [Pseudomonas mosselii]|uniref:class I SAM-dependent methyltransferase n=1 Tax=Pseudomonas mosselii TaxID=78327 RepID=UPI001F41DBF9|nr:class I SAM-dependent methyltransferase [Pseudomonas mosselii]MDH0626914.1 methyltransferase [Pseudomonas mosselii]MDH0678514.1 methyltransferase [Pseudomonas mosselii]MDH0923777.1 methyltransferase [Pseudomonas mosselii]MDH1134224.1 methyltransferase [Pseudomonas mosselii]MDH1138138.1 methyltransferase [Pseudomonas mosselii]
MKTGFRKDFYKELATLEGKNFWFRARNKIIIWALKKYMPQLTSFHEIGCGTGFVISAVAHAFPEAHLSGSEYFNEGLVYARQRLPDVEFQQMDARQINFASAPDVIGAFDVLEHIEEDEQVLDQMAKALAPNGMLFITVPQHRWLWSSVDVHACHVRRYKASELHGKMVRAGLEVVRSTSFVSTLLPAMYLSRLMKRHSDDAKPDEMAELRIHPALNGIFEWALNLELAIIRQGLNLPLGGSRLVVARKLPTAMS